MITPHDVLVGFALPLILALVVMLLTRRAWGAALATGAAYVLGHVLLDGWPGIPPILAYDWLVYAAVVGAIMGIVESAPRIPPILLVLLRLLAVGGLVDVTLKPLVPDTLSVGQAVAWGISVTLLAAAVWSETARASAKGRGLVPAVVWLLVVAGASLALGLSNSAKFMHLGGALVAGILPVAFFAARQPGRAMARGLCAPCILILTGLLLNGRFYSDLPDWASLVFMLVPLAMCLRNALLAVIVAVIPIAAILIPLIQRFNADMGEM